MTKFLSILVVENDADDVFFLTNLLNRLQDKEINPQIHVVSNLEEGIQCLNDGEFDIIITDLYLPDSQGINTFLELQKRSGTIPIIIVGSVVTEESVIREAVKLGAQDFLPTTDLNVSLLSRIINHAIERHRLHESLKALSFTDELTGLYNRRGFITLTEQQMSFARRVKKGFYLFLIDLDYLKQINDTHGHLIGDRALIDMAKILRSSFRKHDIIGRIGGDEFAVVILNTEVESGEYLKQHLLEKSREFNQQITDLYQIIFSLGKAYYDGIHEISLDELLQKADDELYQEKRIAHHSKLKN